MSQGLRTQRKSKKSNRKKRIFIWILTPLLVIALSAVAYGTFLYNKAETAVSKSYKPVKASSKRVETVDPTKDNVSLLLIGVDDSSTRKFGKGTRSDALMVVTLNKKQNSVKLLSIPRDSYVKIPGRTGKTKINAAHAYGGTDLTIETVQELLNIPIDYYVKMNFNAFMDVVDAVGGIDAEVPYLIKEQDSKDRQNAIVLKPGMQHLNGEEALALARTRHQDSDIYRGLRQQELIKSIISKTISVNSITKMSKVIDAVGQNMETNLSFSEMKSFFSYAVSGSNLNFETLTLEGGDLTIGGVYYYQLDPHSLANVQLQLKTQLSATGETTADSQQNTTDSKTNKTTSSSN